MVTKSNIVGDNEIPFKDAIPSVSVPAKVHFKFTWSAMCSEHVLKSISWPVGIPKLTVDRKLG